MKIFIYFLLWSLIMFIAIFFTVVVTKLLIKLVSYFETDSFTFGAKDFIDAIEIGCIMGTFLGAVVCLVTYLKYKKR